MKWVILKNRNFDNEQEANGLLSSSGIKARFCKIPLVGLRLF